MLTPLLESPHWTSRRILVGRPRVVRRRRHIQLTKHMGMDETKAQAPIRISSILKQHKHKV